MSRLLQSLVLVLGLAALLVPFRTAAAAEKTFYLSSYSSVRFYDAEGNTLDLSLDTEVRANRVTIIGVKSILNGVFVGYAQPVLTARNNVDFWDARGVRVRLINDQYTVRSSELGPWYWEQLGPVNTDPSSPPVQTGS